VHAAKNFLPGAAKTFRRRPFMPSLRRCSFALRRDWIDRNMTTHLSRRNAMNTHNANVKTATPESPKTWGNGHVMHVANVH
jgi:hypothetical protein